MYASTTPANFSSQFTRCRVCPATELDARQQQAHFDVSIDYAINNRLTPFISMQNHYNAVYREEEREMFPTLKVPTVFPRHLTLELIALPCRLSVLALFPGRRWLVASSRAR